jgi:hypothetical protein
VGEGGRTNPCLFKYTLESTTSWACRCAILFLGQPDDPRSVRLPRAFGAWLPSFAASNPLKPGPNATGNVSDPPSQCGHADRGFNGLHPALRADWRAPLEVLFGLDELAAACRSQNRWSFWEYHPLLKLVGGGLHAGLAQLLFSDFASHDA